MTASHIADDPYIIHLRDVFAKDFAQPLEFVLSDESLAIPECDYFRRTINYHRCMVPWIEDVFPLEGASVLEIGCGSGAATIAMAQRCAHVDAFDIDVGALAKADANLAEAGVGNVSVHTLAPDWAVGDGIATARSAMRPRYDAVLLPAVLEHMTIGERLSALSLAWDLLRVGGVLVVYDTPNRLHTFDQHSFRLPFFNWLPDELALLYSDRSPRAEYLSILNTAADLQKTLYRLGRGVSYHEIDLAVGLTNLEVIQDSYSRLLRHREINSGPEGLLMDVLRQHAPHVPACFSREFLEFVARKKWDKAGLVARHSASDELLDGKRPALVIQGTDAFLDYDIGSGADRVLLVDVLRHPWSSELRIFAGDGPAFHQEVLTNGFAITDVLRIPLPGEARRIRLSVAQHPGALGCQAWIMGVGTA